MKLQLPWVSRFRLAEMRREWLLACSEIAGLRTKIGLLQLRNRVLEKAAKKAAKKEEVAA